MLNILFVCRNGSGAGRSDVDLYAFVRRRVEGNGSLESQHCENFNLPIEVLEYLAQQIK